MRKRSEIDPDKFASLVVDDEPKYEHNYKSEYRGRVQNRQVETNYLPMFQLSYFPNTQNVSGVQAFDKAVEDLNQQLSTLASGTSASGSKAAAAKGKISDKVYIVCSKEQLDENGSMKIFSLIDKLSAELSVAKDIEQKKLILMRRAIAHSVLRDFEAAISDFTYYISLDDKNALAYWQRAVCQAEMDEFNKAEGKGVVNIHSAEADFSDAYIYYNRGNLHAGRNELSKAIDDYTIALKIDNRLAEAYYNRGIARAKSGNRQAGIQDLSKAGELGLYDAYSVIKRLNKAK